MTLTTPLQVLIADDESLVVELIASLLETAGHCVAGRAYDGRQATALTRDLRPDVVLMDISMPEQDGVAAAAEIQAVCPTPVVILSAYQGVEDLTRATDAGIGAYLVKPPRGSDLQRAMTVAIARHADLMELRRLNSELKQAMAEIKTLTGLLPVCCGCKQVRDDKGYWKQVEIYITTHTNAQVTHTYCPKCLEHYFPGWNTGAGAPATDQIGSQPV